MLFKVDNATLKQLEEKQKKLKKAEPATRKGGNLMKRINTVCDHVQKKLGHYKEQLELIQTKERLHEYIDSAIKQDIISIDTETTGLDPITDKIVGACIYTRGEKPAYIPINHISYLNNNRLNDQLTEEEVAEEFQRLIDAKTKAIFFNAKFDIRVMRWQLGVYFTPTHCGFIAGKCLKEDEPEGNLKYLWKKYCCPPDFEEPALTFDKMFEGICFNLIPISTAYLYAAKDALMTQELYDFQMQYLDENNPKCQEADLTRVAKLYREIELPIINIVADIEDQGVVIDVDYGKKLSEEYNKKLKEAEEKFHEAIIPYENQINAYMNSHPESKLENPININSPIQIAELFYDVLKVPSPSKKDPRGTGKDILKAMGHPLCEYILEYKNIAKLVSTYIDALPQMVNKKTGRLHCNFNQYGANCLSFNNSVHLAGSIKLIGEICEENIPNMEYDKFYELKIPIINRNRTVEYTSHAIKFKNREVIKLEFDDNSCIEGTFEHPILCNDEFIELQNIHIGDKVDSFYKGKNALTVINKTFDVADVYDFKVPNTHSFASNSVISHNTGRFSCIAKGTLISTPSGNKPIEEIQAGDYVYSYTDDGKLSLNKVKQSWYTGNRECVKLSWVSKYNPNINGELICTPEHCLKTTVGWVQAKDIKPNQSVYFVRRSSSKRDKYMRISGMFKQGHEREQIWIKENFFNNYDKSLQVHHKDKNRLNNHPDNLIICTPKEHVKLHREMKDGFCGAHDFTKEELIEMCEKVGWDLQKVPHDYWCLKGWLKQYRINYIKKYTESYATRPCTMRSHGKSFKYKSLPMTKENLKYALDLANNDFKEAASYFGENANKFISKCEKYGILENHNVVSIEYLDGLYDVYDIEVENAHCFIANELCVHNSSNPNFQNLPSKNHDVRQMFTAAKYAEIESENNIINLLWGDIVPTTDGEKDSQNLQVGDFIVCDDGNHQIKNINTENDFIYVEI